MLCRWFAQRPFAKAVQYTEVRQWSTDQPFFQHLVSTCAPWNRHSPTRISNGHLLVLNLWQSRPRITPKCRQTLRCVKTMESFSRVERTVQSPWNLNEISWKRMRRRGCLAATCIRCLRTLILCYLVLTSRLT